MNTPRLIYSFDEAIPGTPAEIASLLGGKGASLAAMTRAGLRVPPGFTISTEACRHFYEHGERWPDGLEAQVRAHIERLEEQTGRLFGGGSKPLLVSVRSGAPVSMPGMMDTILNCHGWDVLVESIDAVFRSWNSERALAYRRRHDIRGLLGTAVNVQIMFPSQVSGVVFTQDPNQFSAQQLVIESAFGLGEAVVSGDVTPDRFLVKRDNLDDVQTFRGASDKVTLAPGQIRELATLCLAVEQHFGKPMDIEWGWADGEFALLQCRGIPGLEVAQDAEVARTEEVSRLRALAGKQRRVWVTHNLRETLRAPTPLTWDIVRRFMSGSGGFGLMYQDFGYRPSAEVCERGFLELICGRIYADPERLSQLFWDGLPMSYDLAAILRDKNELERAPTKFDPAKADEQLLLKLPGALRSLLRSSRNLKRLRKSVKRVFEIEILPPYLDYVREKRAADLRGRTTPEVVQEVHDRCERVLNVFGKESLKPAFFGGLALGVLETLLAQLGGEAEGARVASTLTMALDNDSTYEQDALLYRVAKGEAALEDFIAQYGHRATGEMELAEPRWREDQSYLRQVIAQIGRSSGKAMPDIHRENVRKYTEARTALPTLLQTWGGSSFAEEIEEHLTEARALLPYRETGKHYLMMGYELIRLALLEIAGRWGIGNDLFFLHLGELEQFEAREAELRAEIARRKIRWKSVQRFELPDVIDSDHLDQLGVPQVFENATEWRGEPVSAGVANGTARVVFDPREVEELGTDYVLVCPSTDPGWTPLFINARGLIVERGGVLSHGAIVARDFGIPAIVCPNATKLLRSGDRIRVDGNTGIITKLENS